MSAVPLERLAQAVWQVHPWAPVGQLAQLGRVDVLAIDLAVRRALAEVLGLDAGPRRSGDLLDDLADGVWVLAPCVEGLPPRPLAVERGLDRQVGGDRVVDVQEVALRAAVGADL